MSDSIIVIGSGPAGVSVTRPLLEAGLPVTVIDAGAEDDPVAGPARPSLAAMRQGATDAWRHLLGDDYRGLRFMPEVSPKLRLAAGPENFAVFGELNRVTTRDFVAVGTLARGGLSNIWGAVTFAYDDHDMAGWPIGAGALTPHYRRISARMGISGPQATELDRAVSPLLLQEPLPLSALDERILRRYARAAKDPGFHLGRTRMAVLSDDLGSRRACTLSNACIIGCERGAVYNAAFELAELSRHSAVTIHAGTAVERIVPAERGWWVEGRERGSGTQKRYHAGKVILAAGAIASTRLALAAAQQERTTVRLETSPSVAFAVLFPGMLGAALAPQSFGLAQLTFSRALDSADPADEMIGFLYPAASMSASEFLLRMPVSIAGGRRLLREMLPGLLIGLAFMPGRYSDNRATFVPAAGAPARLEIEGGHAAGFAPVLTSAIRRLRRDLMRIGGILLPGSVEVVQPGADVHYAGTLSMGGYTDSLGELKRAPGLHLVDGAVLPTMPARNPTLTIMANAERIGAGLAQAWGERR